MLRGMKSLLDPTEAGTMLGRLRALSAESTPQWGEMSVGQMLAHCATPMRMAMGDVKLKRSFLGKMLGWMIRKVALGPKPFRQGLPTDKRFVVTDEREFAAEQAGLIELVERFAAGGPDGITKEPHAFFGPMSAEEWDWLMWKHLDHHLRQFAV